MNCLLFVLSDGINKEIRINNNRLPIELETRMTTRFQQETSSLKYSKGTTSTYFDSSLQVRLR